MFDDAMRHSYETLAENGVSSITFWRSHKDILGMFSNPAHLENIFSCSDRVADAAEEITTVVAGSAIGAALLKSESLKVSRAQLLRKVDTRLEDLIHMNFDSVSLAAFRESMVNETKGLIKLGAKPYDKIITKIKYLGVT